MIIQIHVLYMVYISIYRERERYTDSRLLLHCRGDAAAKARSRSLAGPRLRDINPVMSEAIDAPTTRPDQITRIRAILKEFDAACRE